MKKTVGMIFLTLFFLTSAFAEHRTINLTVEYKTVYFADKARQAIAVNQQIPAPTLHFKEGNHVTINVCNRLKEKTAIHWHGMLVPWQMDGVEGVSQRGIPPGGVFHYQFTLEQAGTYWYHAHAGLQEQQGLYGALLVDPLKAPPYQYDKDYVIVLSDWSNTCPDQILANLKKEGDYYSPRFPLQASLAKFIHDYRKSNREDRKKLMDDYKEMQKMRMGLYDISDVAYDAFLLNGMPNAHPWTALVNIGDTVRLRFIGAAGGTIYRVKIHGAAMQMVHVQGNDVEPYSINDFTIAPGETYDVLVKIQENTPYIIYAESADTLGAAYGALITSPLQCVNFRQVPPFPEPLPVTRQMMSMMMGMHDMGHMQAMHGMGHMQAMPKGPQASMSHTMPTEATIVGDKLLPPQTSQTTSPGTKYQELVAAVKTNDPHKPIAAVIKMELFGYMDRFIWFINGVPGYKAKPILLYPGRRYRIIFTNTSMMRHPMHIHGHWMILRKGNDAYDPLLHTIDVPPGATIVADIDTDASGQWFFHCHLLFHMMTGMSRVFQYSTLLEITKGEACPQNIIQQTAYLNRPIVRVDAIRPMDVAMVKHPEAHPASLWLATFLDVGIDPFHNAQQVTYKGLYGFDYHKLELFINDAEIKKGSVENADLDIFYWQVLSQFWAVKAGANYFYRPALKPYWQPGIGIEGLMPYFIDTDVRAYYYSGSAKLDVELSRDTQLTNNFFLRLGIRSILASKTVTRAQLGSGLNQMQYTIRPYYRIMPGLNVFIEYEHDQDYGAFKRLQKNDGESASENTWTLGLGLLF